MKAGELTEKTEERIQTLVTLAKRKGGVLEAEHVLDEARNPESTLHEMFEWNDTVAGHEYRLAQARHLIRATVRYLPENPREEIRVFVSLKSDQKQEGGGYRLLTDVMSDEELYRQLLNDALRDYDAFRNRYNRLRELEPLFREGDRFKKDAATAQQELQG